MSARDEDPLWQELFEQFLDQGCDEDSAVYSADEAYELALAGGYEGARDSFDADPDHTGAAS